MSRRIFSMDKDWKFHLGDVSIHYGKGHGDVYCSFAKAGGHGGPAIANWNDNDWEIIDAPHDWVAKLDFDKDERANFGYKPRGIGWYRKRFCLEDADKGKQLLLAFDGISGNSKIYFNGSILERNFSGYNSFIVDISDRAFYGNKPNILTIKVDASFWEGWWYEGAGLYRHTYLIKKEPIHIAQWGTWVNSTKKEGNLWDTKIETTIENSSYSDEEYKLISTILDADGNEVQRDVVNDFCAGGEQTIVTQSIIIENPKLWDIDSPNLYKLASQVYKGDVLVDDDTTTFGYRSIRFCKDTGFYLNDKRVKIMGTCNHQDHAGVGVALPDSIHEYRIKLLKEMGSNAYRCAHNNPAKEILDACDKMGMLVMDENRNFESSTQGIKEVETMVKRDRNHPCVIMYSIFNEEPLQGTLQGRNIAKKLMHTIKRLDNTRPVLGALNGGVMEQEGTADILDITGINYQLGIFDSFHKKYPNQLILASESASAFSTRGVYETDLEKHVHDSYDIEKAPWGATVRQNWEAVNTRDFVMGTFIWTGFDYLGEPTPFTWPSVSTAFGIMDTCGFPKDSFYLYQSYFKKEPMVHILPHWNFEGREGQPIKVMCHTNCEEVELFLNDNSLGKKKIPLYEQAEWNVEYEKGALRMDGFVAGKLVAQDKVETTTTVFTLKLEPDRDLVFGDGLDAIPVNVSAVDQNGRFVPTACNKVKFEVEGLGNIIGVGNGDPNCHEPGVANERSLFNGRCQAIIKSIEGSGVIKITAHSDGMKPAEIIIPVKPKNPPIYINSIYETYLSNWRMTSKLSLERPDPNIVVADSDMNTWEPVDIDSGEQKKFDGKKDYYALYRTEFELDCNDNKQHTIHFYKLLGEIEVYANGIKIGGGTHNSPSELKVAMSENLTGKITLTVLVKNISKLAGICQSVALN